MRPRAHAATRVTWQAYHVLAALLLADGEHVRAADLADGLFPWPIPESSVRTHIKNMRRLGVDTIQTDCPRRRRSQSRGYRLIDIPPDEHLEPMLACVPAVKRSAWWSARVSRTHTRAS